MAEIFIVQVKVDLTKDTSFTKPLPIPETVKKFDTVTTIKAAPQVTIARTLAR